MDENLNVSVVVPVYNAVEHLEECVEAALAQSLEGLEVILVDDGSTDQSPGLCDKLAEDGRVRVIHQQNAGPGEARNRGLAAARGKYVGFVDADDIPTPGMYKALFNAAESSGADMVFCDYLARTAAGDLPLCSYKGGRDFDGEKIKKLLLPYFFGYSDEELPDCRDLCPFADYSSYVWLCLYRKKSVEGLEFPSQRTYYNEDQLYNLGAVMRARRAVHLPQPLYIYRDSDTSLTKRYSEDYLAAKLNRFRYLRRLIDENGFGVDFRRRLENKICLESVTVINYYVNASGPSAKEKREKILETVTAPEIKAALAAFDLGRLRLSPLKIFLSLERRGDVNLLYFLSFAHRSLSRRGK